MGKCGVKYRKIGNQKISADTVASAIESVKDIENINESAIQSFKLLPKGVNFNAWKAFLNKARKAATNLTITESQITGDNKINQTEKLVNILNMNKTEVGSKLLPTTVEAIQTLKRNIIDSDKVLNESEVNQLISSLESLLSADKQTTLNAGKINRAKTKLGKLKKDGDIEGYDAAAVESFLTINPEHVLPNAQTLYNKSLDGVLVFGSLSWLQQEALLNDIHTLADIQAKRDVGNGNGKSTTNNESPQTRGIRIKTILDTKLTPKLLNKEGKLAAQKINRLKKDDLKSLDNNELRDLQNAVDVLAIEGIATDTLLRLLAKLDKPVLGITQDLANEMAANVEGNESTIMREVGKSNAERGASSKKRTKEERLGDWFAGSKTEDLQGHIDKFASRNPGDARVDLLNQLQELYENDYTAYEGRTQEETKRFNDLIEDIAQKHGINESKLKKALEQRSGGRVAIVKLLEQGSGIMIGDMELSNHEALAIYTSNDANLNPEIHKRVSEGLTPALKELGDKLWFEVPASSNIFIGFNHYINKTLLKESLVNFMTFKDAHFTPGKIQAMGRDVGPDWSEAMQWNLNYMSGQDMSTSSDWLSTWVLQSVGVIMFVNVKSAMQQLLSVWNYMEGNNIVQFNRDVFSIPVDKKNRQLFVELWDDPMMTVRREKVGFDVNAEEIVEALKAGSYNGFITKLLNAGFVATTAMDSIAIATGGVAFVKAQMAKGMSKENALKLWRKKTQEAQQSSRPDKVSMEQKSNIGRFIMSFANTPAQYFRLSRHEYRLMKQPGRTTEEQLRSLRKIAYYQMIQSVIFTIISTGSAVLLTGWGDDEEQEKAQDALVSMSGSTMRGMGIKGAALNMIVNIGRNIQKETDDRNPDYTRAIITGVTTLAPAINKKVRDFYSIGDNIKYNKKGELFDGQSLITTTKAMEMLSNLPFEYVRKKLLSVQRYIEGDATAMEMMQMLYGYSEYTVLGPEKDWKKNKDKIY